MLTYEEAKKIGFGACEDLIGKDVIEAKKDELCYGSGDVDEFAYCYVAAGFKPGYIPSQGLVLSEMKDKGWMYIAKCKVWYKDSNIEFLDDCILPDHE